MFYSIMQAEQACEVEPSLIFSLIKENDMEVVSKIISKEGYNFNIVDENGNNLLMYLLKYKKYNLVLKYINKVDINHQNNNGDTITHLLVSMDYPSVRYILDEIFQMRLFIPNIKNNQGETILDRSINNNYLYMTIKILEDNRFNLIDVYSFKNLYETYIKSNNYGKYSKLSNLEIIIDNLENKPLIPKMEKLINLIQKNMETIRNDFNLSKTENLDNIINLFVMDSIS